MQITTPAPSSVGFTQMASAISHSTLKPVPSQRSPPTHVFNKTKGFHMYTLRNIHKQNAYRMIVKPVSPNVTLQSVI